MTADLLSSWATNMMLALLTFLVIWVLRHDPQATIEALIQRLWSGPQRGGKDSQPAKAPASSTSLPTGAKLASAFSGPRSRSARTPTTILRMTTKELRAYVISLGGSVDDCVEKAHLQQRALQLSTQHNGQLPERGSAGWTSEESRLEREDLADELPELSAKERDDMLQSWESMNLAERDFTPSRKDLDEQLERAKSEMAACMYRAAYEELSESEANSLVVKMRELKELMAVTKELIKLDDDESKARRTKKRAARQGTRAKLPEIGQVISHSGSQCTVLGVNEKQGLVALQDLATGEEYPAVPLRRLSSKT